MKKLIFGLMFIPILLLGQTTYYVSDQGSNSDNGLTLTTAFLTVDYAVSTAITPGDIILIFTGDEFRETVTMDASGTDGSPITVSIVDSATGLTGAAALALGDTATISGADLVDTWAEYINPEVLVDTVTASPAANLDDVDTWPEDVYDDADRVRIGTLNTAGKNLEVGIRFINIAVPKDATIDSASLTLTSYETSSDVVLSKVYGEDDATPAIYSVGDYADWNGRDLTTANVDWDYTAWDSGSTYNSPDLKTIVSEITSLDDWASGNNMAFQIRDDGTGQGWLERRICAFNKSGGAQKAILNVLFTVPADSVWSTAMTDSPRVVFMDDIVLTWGSHQDSLSDHEWHWGSDTLFIRDDTGDLDDRVVIEASIRSECISAWEDSNVVFQYLKLEKSYDQSIRVGTSSQCALITLSSLTIVDAGEEAITINGVCPTDMTIESCTITNWARGSGDKQAIATMSTAQGGALTIKNNIITGDFQGDDSNTNNDAIYVSFGNPVIIESNIITGADHGIYLEGAANAQGKYIGAATVRYNKIIDCSDDSFWLNGLDNPDTEIYYNLSINCGDNGFDISNTDTFGLIANNVIYRTYNSALKVAAVDPYGTFKNNIIMNWDDDDRGGVYCISFFTPVDNVGSMIFDNNIYYKSGSSNFHNSTDYGTDTFAQWQVSSSQDANSYHTDPLFTDVANDDFTLRPLSLCIDNGIDVGLIRDFNNDILYGIPDIGAFEYIPPEKGFETFLRFDVIIR